MAGQWLVFVVVLVWAIACCAAVCPHQASGLKRWSSPATWPHHQKPGAGDHVVINQHVLLDESPPELYSITIKPSGSLVFSPDTPISLTLRSILILGDMHIGSHDCRFTGKVHITLIGNRGETTADPDWGEKYIAVSQGGTLELHGEDKLSWTKLTRTVDKLANDPGLHYEHVTSADRTGHEWKQGLTVFVFDQHTGRMLRREYFGTAVTDDWTREHEPRKLVSFLNDVNDGEVVAMTVQHSLVRGNAHALHDVYDAVERLAYGHVTGNSTVRTVSEKDAFVLIAQKGNPSRTVDAIDRNTGTPTQRAQVSMTIWERHLKVTAESFVDNTHSYRDYPNVRSMTTNAGYPTLHLLDDVTTWRPGDRIVVASTDYKYQQAEEATVVRCTTCSANTLKVDLEPQFMHWGEVTNGVDMRGEVGILTRNILIEGRMADHCPASNGNCNHFHYDTFGGHLKFVRGFKNVHIEGVELYHMGQQTEKGFYPIHFHICFDVDGVGGYSNPPYVKDNSIHHCFSRCVTVHGTHGVTVADNVGYNTLGHCYFLEDGGEKRNTFDGNLGLSTRKGKILPSDDEPATYWFTSPLVTVRNNVAAGGEGVGYWYVFPDAPMGPSAGLGFLQRDEARHTAYTEFTNNVAHSYFKAGLFADNKVLPDETVGDTNHYEPLQDPLDKTSGPKRVLLNRPTAYKNGFQNVWIRGGWFVVDHASLSDSSQGITMARSSNQEQFVRNSIIVGESINVGEPTSAWNGSIHIPMPRAIPLEYDMNCPIQGFIFYDGPVYGENIWFDGFKQNENYTASAIGFHRHNYYGSSPVSSLTNIRFGYNDGKLTHRVYDGHQGVSGFTSYDGDRMATFRDIDGSVTGVAGTQVVKPGPYFTTARCYIEIYSHDHSAQQHTEVTIVRDDVPNHPEHLTWGDARNFLTVLGGTHSYTMHWTGTVPSDFELRGHGVEKGQWVRVGVCIPRNADFNLYTYAPVYKPNRDQWISLNSVAQLDADTSGYAYFWDQHTGLLFFKFISFDTRSTDESKDCPNGKCPHVQITIKSGDLSDGDCRSRAYGPYKRHPIFLTTGVWWRQGWGAGRTRPFKTRSPVNGGFGSWSQWSSCSQSCGGGTEIRTRMCNNPRPENDGRGCDGGWIETRQCNRQSCQPLLG
ncbi:hypothetical protein BaRGS_00017145 [Batillaria attramentaria]|uniref:G8 domain-containing protein n=1 Tax=Batillaria attramentaria TaxID=370345 RepID=A0ABD0KX67_9CAEN